MYFDATTESSSLQLPSNRFDTTRKEYFRHMSNNNSEKKSYTAWLLVLAIVVVFLTLASGISFGMAPFTSHVPNHDESNSSSEKEQEVLKELDSKNMKPSLTDAPSESTEEERKQYTEIFRKWDLSEEEYENKSCEEGMEAELCPSEASVSCGSVTQVETFCRALLGETLVGDMHFRATGTGTNALEGCKNYVSYDRGSCCHSSHCHYELNGEDNDDSEEEAGFIMY